MNRNEYILDNLLKAEQYLDAYLAQLQIAQETEFPQNVAPLTLAVAFQEIYLFYLQQAENPCVDAVDQNECYILRLADFGVTIKETQGFPAQGTIYNIVPFPEDPISDARPERKKLPLQVVLDGVLKTGAYLATYIQLLSGNSVTPEQAFQLILGPVEFGYFLTVGNNEPENYALTALIDDPTGSGPVHVLLTDDSFLTNALPAEFVVIHELGHVFHFRYNASRESSIIQDYASAISAVWTPFARKYYVGQSSITINERPCSVENNCLVLLTCAEVNCTEGTETTPANRNGQVLTDPSTYEYYIEIGNYRRGDGGYGNYEGFELAPNQLFPNEYCDSPNGSGCHPNQHPMEGFADTFANMVLNPELLPDDEPRKNYFEVNMRNWVVFILVQRS